MDVVANQELLKHLTRSHQEVAVATLTPELERAFHSRIRRNPIRGSSPDVGRDNNLEVTLDSLRELHKVRRAHDPSQFGMGRDGHVSFKGNMFLITNINIRATPNR